MAIIMVNLVNLNFVNGHDICEEIKEAKLEERKKPLEVACEIDLDEYEGKMKNDLFLLAVIWWLIGILALAAGLPIIYAVWTISGSVAAVGSFMGE